MEFLFICVLQEGVLRCDMRIKRNIAQAGYIEPSIPVRIAPPVAELVLMDNIHKLR